jgi:hypothetical protein
MSLNRGIVNPLSLLKLRKLSFIPQHFQTIKTLNPNGNKEKLKNLDQWINYHLNSRYAIKNTLMLDHGNKMVEAIEIGIEDPKEIILLSLGCPHLHKN